MRIIPTKQNIISQNPFVWFFLALIILFIIFFGLKPDVAEHLNKILYASSTILILYTAYQAYYAFEFNSKLDVSEKIGQEYIQIMNSIPENEFNKYYNLNGLTEPEFKWALQVALEIENLNTIYEFSKKNFDFTFNQGVQNQIRDWIQNPVFQKYWDANNQYFEEPTRQLVSFFLKQI